MARTIFGNHQRYEAAYFKPYPGYYFTGDGAYRDKARPPAAAAASRRVGRRHLHHGPR